MNLPLCDSKSKLSISTGYRKEGWQCQYCLNWRTLSALSLLGCPAAWNTGMEGAELSGSLWGLSADDLCTGAGDVAAGVVSVLESRRCEGWLRVVPVCNLRSGKPQPVSRQDLGPPSLQCYRHHHHHVHHHHIVSLGPSPSIWYNIDPWGRPELQTRANLGNILDCNGKGVLSFGG